MSEDGIYSYYFSIVGDPTNQHYYFTGQKTAPKVIKFN